MPQADLGCPIVMQVRQRRPPQQSVHGVAASLRGRRLPCLSECVADADISQLLQKLRVMSRERSPLVSLLHSPLFLLGSPPSPLCLLSPPPLLPFPSRPRVTHWPRGKLNLDLSPAHEKCRRVKTLQRPAKSCHSLAHCQWPLASPRQFQS